MQQTRFLLDTNVISELRKNKPHGTVLEWINGIQNEQLFLSAVTIGEIQKGIEITRAQHTSEALDKANEIQQWLTQVMATSQILPVDAHIYQRWATLMFKKDPPLYEDALIAATALQHDLTIATRNVTDFQHFPVNIVNPFE